MIALVRLSPREIVKVYEDVPGFIEHPDKPKSRLVQPAVVGWRGGGELTYNDAPKLDGAGNPVTGNDGRPVMRKEATEGAAQFEIVDVVRALIPSGQRISGQSEYAFDRSGSVIETVTLEVIPAPVPSIDLRKELSGIKTRLSALEAP